jgi:hypothetical protein
MAQQTRSGDSEYTTTDELLEALLSIWSMSYHRRICGAVYPLGIGLVNTFLQQKSIVGGIVFYAICVISKKSRRLALTRTSLSPMAQKL